MTKRHFEAFAAYIAQVPDREIAAHLAAMVATVAEAANPRFDRAWFYRACGLGE